MHRTDADGTLVLYSATTESKDQYGASSVPIYQTATFKGLNGEYDYTRSGNPTRTALGTSSSSTSTPTEHIFLLKPPVLMTIPPDRPLQRPSLPDYTPAIERSP